MAWMNGPQAPEWVRRAAIVSAPLLALGVVATAAPSWAAGDAGSRSVRAATVPVGVASPDATEAGASGRLLAALRTAAASRPDGSSSSTSPAGWGKGKQTAEFSDPTGQPYDDFGYAIAFSGNGKTAVVGAYGTAGYAGAVYVYTKSGGTWTQSAALSSPGGGGSEFGVAVAVSRDGTELAASAVGENFSGGAVHIYTNTGGTWSQTADLTASDESANWDTGQSIALSADGSTLLAGAPGAFSQKGAAYVFSNSGGSWSQTAELTASDGVSGDGLGFPVTVSANGTTVAVGAPEKSTYAGGVYVYGVQGGTWKQTAEIAAPGSGTQFFGWAAALSRSGSRLVVGAPYANGSAGAAYVFGAKAGKWHQTDELTVSDGGEFGFSVALAIKGSTIAVGAPVGHSSTGAAYVFGGKGGTWKQRAELTPSDGASGDGFGTRVALSVKGSVALVGAYGHNSYQGSTYVFKS